MYRAGVLAHTLSLCRGSGPSSCSQKFQKNHSFGGCAARRLGGIMLVVKGMTRRFSGRVGKEERGYALHAYVPRSNRTGERGYEGWKFHVSLPVLNRRPPARGGVLRRDRRRTRRVPRRQHLGLGATVQISPVFTLDDMPRVTVAIEQAVQKYG